MKATQNYTDVILFLFDLGKKEKNSYVMKQLISNILLIQFPRFFFACFESNLWEYP